jgi:antitoxin component HigA of HigAB toxin-antitoxin module
LEQHTPLHKTLQRLDDLIGERGLNRSDILDPQTLAARTALPQSTVRSLLKGAAPPADTVNERVCARIKALSDAYLARSGKRMSDLAAAVAARLEISDVWARSVCDGKKIPNVTHLHRLVQFFDVDGGESFFTAPADEALNRVLLPALQRLEHPEQDPVAALLDRYGVKGADLRAHGSVSRVQLERILEGVLRSVAPEEEDPQR